MSLHPMNRSYSHGDSGADTVPALQLPDFTRLQGPNGEIVLVPRFMVPLAELQMEGVRKSAEMPLDEAKNGVSLHLIIDYVVDIWVMAKPRRLPLYDSSIIAEGRLYADPEPVHCRYNY